MLTYVFFYAIIVCLVLFGSAQLAIISLLALLCTHLRVFSILLYSSVLYNHQWIVAECQILTMGLKHIEVQGRCLSIRSVTSA